jgi:sodium-dependent dicarboxylate transporter 2/3/5
MYECITDDNDIFFRDNVLEDDDDPAFRRLCKCLTLSIAYAANVGGIGSLTGTGPNLVMKGQLDM